MGVAAIPTDSLPFGGFKSWDDWKIWNASDTVEGRIYSYEERMAVVDSARLAYTNTPFFKVIWEHCDTIPGKVYTTREKYEMVGKKMQEYAHEPIDIEPYVRSSGNNGWSGFLRVASLIMGLFMALQARRLGGGKRKKRREKRERRPSISDRYQR